VSYLALAGGAVKRDFAAGVLWPAVSEKRAHMSLRSALTRLGARIPGLVLREGPNISLGIEVRVDLHEAQVVARGLLDPSVGLGARDAATAIGALSADLLPGWYDEWAMLEAETWRQLRLHALEALAQLLADTGRFGDAVAAAQAAVAADPLRESSYAALIAVHMSEGNQSEALRAFERCRRRLSAALGLEPTDRLRALLPS
jgi:DNA-binding SARP family transcriptional activator